MSTVCHQLFFVRITTEGDLGISVVDHREVTDDEIVFLASEFAGDRLDEFGLCNLFLSPEEPGLISCHLTGLSRSAHRRLGKAPHHRPFPI